MKLKSNLNKAINKTQALPDDWFGSESLSIEDLPSIKNKKDKVRKNLFIESDTAAYLEKQSKEYGVPFASLASDILTGFVKREISKKKKG